MSKERYMGSRRYSVLVSSLSQEDGGGFLATVPDLPGCMSDGETLQEALIGVQGAIESGIEAAHDLGRNVPQASKQKAWTGS